MSRLLVIFLVVFIDLLGFGIVIPILPYYGLSFGASPAELGWLMTGYSLMQFIFSPIWGSLSDRIGRKPVLLVSILGTALAMAGLAQATSMFTLYACRLLAGFFAANISTAYAYIADITTPENRSKGMGALGAAFGLGFIFGPAIGGIMSTGEHYQAPIWFAAGLAALNFILAVIILKEPNLTREVRASHRNKRLNFKMIGQLTRDRRLGIPVLLGFLMTLAITQMEMVFALFMKLKFSLDSRHAGMLLAITGSAMVIIQGGLIHRLTKKYGELKLVQYGMIICGLGLLGFAYSNVLALTGVFLGILSIGHGLLHPSLSSMTSQAAAKDAQGGTMGVFQSASSLARIIGPLTAGFLYQGVSPEAPLLAGVAFLAVGAWLSRRSFSA